VHKACAGPLQDFSNFTLPPLLLLLLLVSQEARCIEEVQLLRFERQRTLQYYTHIINICSQEAGLRLDQAESRMEQAQSSVTQNSSSSGNCSTVGVVDVLDEYSQLLAEALLLQRSVEEHNKWLVQASVAFGKL
jgi:hypothetical protein